LSWYYLIEIWKASAPYNAQNQANIPPNNNDVQAIQTKIARMYSNWGVFTKQ
jgi:hypothetical protein